MTGIYFLRNLRFLSVTRPDPSIRTMYWSYCLTSTIMPVLSHFVGFGPVWFCTRTVSPTTNGGRGRVCSLSRSQIFWCLLRSASSLASSVSRQVGCGRYLPGCTGIKSLIARPKTHIAGLKPVSLSGVLRYWSMALWKLSVFRVPLRPVFSIMRRFTVFTPISARLLLWAKATEDRRWRVPQFCRKVCAALEVYSGPPSDVSSSAMPNVTKVERSAEINPCAPSDACSTMGQLL